MVLQVNDKHKIKYDADEKQYIYYRIIDKSELAAHLQTAKDIATSDQTVVDTFQAYVDDVRVVEKEVEGEVIIDK